MRIDAFRYFLLYHYGGFYADLDSECLRSLDGLNKGRDILLAQESPAHLQKGKSYTRRLPYIVSNAFMGSSPKHPFWLHVIDILQRNKDEWDVLDATGPFMLTQAYESYKPRFSLEPPHYFCSLADKRITSGMQQESDSRLEDVYAIHHWFGSWWKKNSVLALGKHFIRPLRDGLFPLVLPNYKIRAHIAERKEPSLNGKNKHRIITYSKGAITRDEWSLIETQQLGRQTHPPLVSALLVTKNRDEQALRAVHCFLAQTYSPKELVIIDEGERKLERAIKDLNSPLVRYYRNEKLATLGRLRNRAVRFARGDYVCQWDDDDLYHPEKIAYQLALCLERQADACFLLREMLFREDKMSLAVSDYRLWEGSILARKDILPAYPARKRGEDYWVVHRLAQKRKILALDFPELYLYTYHKRNTWHGKHFGKIWNRASRIYLLSRDRKNKLASLAKDYPHLRNLRAVK